MEPTILSGVVGAGLGVRGAVGAAAANKTGLEALKETANGYMLIRTAMVDAAIDAATFPYENTNK